MKIFNYFILLVLINVCHAQNLQFDKISNAIEKQLTNYSCEDSKNIIIMNDSLFNEQVETIFSTVVLNNSDIISNGSAIAFAQDKDKGTFSFNNTVRLNRKTHLDLGLSYENKDAFSLSFYSKNALTNTLGLKIGVLLRLYSSQKIMDGKCDEINKKRELHMRFIKSNEYEILFKKSILDLKQELDKTYQKSANNDKELKEKIENIKLLEVKIQKLDSIMVSDRNKIDDLVNKDFYKYDKENVKFTGYSLHWLNLNGNFKNSRITNDYIKFNDSLPVKRNDDVFKMNLELSYNYFLDNKRVLYLQGFVRLNRGSFLDNPIYISEKEFTLIKNADTNEYDVALNNELIRPYKDLERPYLEGQLGGQFLFLFTKKKYFGFSLKGSYNFPLTCNMLIPYVHNYNLLFGPTFRSNDSSDSTLKLSKSTITFLCGFEQVSFKTNAWDAFIVKASIGIPLTLYKKENSKK